MKIIVTIVLCLISETSLLIAQTENTSHKGQFQLLVGTGLMPVNKTKAQIDFRYIDGEVGGQYEADTITAKYTLQQANFVNTLNIGLGYFFTDYFRTSINLKPYLNSFLANKDKNGEVYGAQIDVGFDYFAPLSKDVNVSVGVSASKIFGGFGITSGGPRIKEYLVVNGNELYDDDIGFHIIDNCWALRPMLGLYLRASDRFAVFINSGFQFTFDRSSRLNFAGLQKDRSVKWNRKSYNDPDVNLIINNTRINQDTNQKLPYRFSGLFFELGTTIRLKHK